MKTIIYAHPWDGSYNHAILKSITDDPEIRKETFQVIDLYKDNFNPVYSTEELRLFSKGETPYTLVKEYQNKLKNSSELVFIFPIWWYDLPAILKGFLDKVLLPKFAYYEDKDENWQGLLTSIEKVTLITTATYSKESLTEYGDAIQGVFMNSTLRGVGIPMENMKWIHFSEVNRTTDERRKEFLKQLPSII
jgi:putative NADPH-quinone reductase